MFKTKNLQTGFKATILLTLLACHSCKKETDPTTASVETSVSSNVTHNSATIGGNVTSSGGAEVTDQGICYNTLPTPTISNNQTQAAKPFTNPYSITLTGLSANTKYYYRAYATNSKGTSYGVENSFTTDFQPVVDVDGNSYKTVLIDGKYWMRENLKVAHYRNGDVITNGLNDAAWSSSTVGAFSYPNNSSANDVPYGKLYNWYAIGDARGIAPIGWHIPSKQEFDALVASVGGQASGGGNLKATTNWTSPNVSATDSYKFTALPSGFRTASGTYTEFGTNAYFWSFTDNGSANKWTLQLANNSAAATVYAQNPTNGFSIRCVKD